MLANKINAKLKSTNKLLLAEEIKLTKQRIKWLNSVIKEKAELTKKCKLGTEKLQAENIKRTVRLPQFGKKVQKIDHVAKQHATSLELQR